MKALLLFLIALLPAFGFSQQAAELHETAKTFMKQGDYTNAVLVLTKAQQLEPENLDIAKDLSVCYLVQKDNDKALAVLDPFIEKETGDDQAYQIVGNIYKAKNDAKNAEKVYKKGMKKYPASGALYSEYGELQWAKKDKSAIDIWEKGIEMDPQYSGNYYNAVRYYFLNADKVWPIIYGEIFVNMEATTGRTIEVKQIMLETYKRLFIADLSKNNIGRNDFEKAFFQTMGKESNLTNRGVTPETLSMIRTRFLLDWNQNYAVKFPLKIFELHKYFLEQGMFDAYNQWLFGPVQNLQAYQNWVTTHHEEYQAFANYQNGRIFRQPKGQYYH